MNVFGLYRKFALTAQGLLGGSETIGYLEKIYSKRFVDSSIAPIYIIGAPRTGSTLLFQLIIMNYYVEYLTNIQNLLYSYPALTKRIMDLFGKPSQEIDIKKSTYGYVKGFFAPTEAGAIHRKWFGETDYSNDDFLKDQLYTTRRSINYISQISTYPLLSKNLFNSMRVNRILKVHPNAFFIWLKREPLYNCQSILIARRFVEGSDLTWNGVKTKEYEKIKKMPAKEQVAHQVKGVNEYITPFIEKLNRKNYIKVTYENICHDPIAQLSAIQDAYYKHSGIKIKKKSGGVLKLPISKKQILNDHDWEELKEAVNKVFEGDV